jgi:hypothetical protein
MWSALDFKFVFSWYMLFFIFQFLQQDNTTLRQDNANLRRDVIHLSEHIEELEQYGRRTSLRG